MLSEELLAELTAICDGAKEMAEGGYTLVYLPGLKIRTGDYAFSQDALLCLQARDGYPTRLFLSQQIQGRGNNWTTHRIVDRTWYTWSWNNVSSDLRPAQVLAEHLRALR
jgi:hypothetical protein